MTGKLGRKVLAVAAAAASLAAGCAVGPRYVKPAVAVPAAYKEAPAPGQGTGGEAGAVSWKPAEPRDGSGRGSWWQAFGDPRLDELEERAGRANQTIAAAAAGFAAARAMVREARAPLFPTLATAPEVTRSRLGPGALPAGFQLTEYALPADASWEPDLWGRVRSGVKASAYAAQASAADLESVRLSVQAELAVDYYQLRAEDAVARVIGDSVAAYQEALDLNSALFRSGTIPGEAVAQAEALLRATQATGVGIVRAQYEHAIASLVGENAASFALAPEAQPAPPATPPAVPASVPSALLERCPDIAAAERAMAQANAQIGVARAAFFPELMLSAGGGYESVSLLELLDWPSRFWSLGASLAQTIFDGGQRRATVQQYEASFDQSAASYRQTVLTACQQVEDQLAALRLLAREVAEQDGAVAAAERSQQEAMARFKSGLDPSSVRLEVEQNQLVSGSAYFSLGPVRLEGA